MAHHHHHHPEPHKTNFTAAFACAVVLNLLFTIIEAVYAFYANSMSLLADAGHNLGDVLGIALSWGAMWLLTKKATEKYSYGFKRTTILAALINALLLVGASVAITIESIHNLLTPGMVKENIIIVLALIGIAVNGGTALMFHKGHHDLNIKSVFTHLIYDALLSFGVVITGIMIYYTHWRWLDPVVGIGIAVTILFGTWTLLRQAVDLILDAVPASIDRNAVEKYLLSLPNVSAIHDLHIWNLSTQEIALTVHLIVPENNLTDEQLHQIHHELADRFHIKHATLQTEIGNLQHCHTNERCN